MSTQVSAFLNYSRMSPRRARLVLNLIKGMDVQAAINQLSFLPLRTAEPIMKLLKSAIANAENNFKLKKQNLRVALARADQGPTIKRSTPRAHGSSSPIRKRTAHITIVVEEKN